MSEPTQKMTKKVSIRELETAIDEFEKSSGDPTLDVDCYITSDLRAEAWRIAFEWRDQFGAIHRLNDEELAELNGGLRVIREKLT